MTKKIFLFLILLAPGFGFAAEFNFSATAEQSAGKRRNACRKAVRDAEDDIQDQCKSIDGRVTAEKTFLKVGGLFGCNARITATCEASL